MELSALLLSRLQFAFTISFHIIFPSFSIGLSAWLTVLGARSLIAGRFTGAWRRPSWACPESEKWQGVGARHERNHCTSLRHLRDGAISRQFAPAMEAVHTQARQRNAGHAARQGRRSWSTQ